MDKLQEPIVPNIVHSDDDLELRQRQMKNRRSSGSAPRAESSASKASSGNGGGSGLTVLALVVALGACGFAGFLYIQLQQANVRLAAAQQVLDDQSKNLQVLNERLSLTGESASLSVDALKTMLKEQDAKLQKVQGSSERNKEMIAGNDKDIVTIGGQIKGVQKVDSEQAEMIEKANLEISGHQERLVSLEAAVQKMPAETEIRMAQNSESIQNLEMKIRSLKEADSSSAQELATLRSLIKQLDARITALHTTNLSK
jgi:chromosome segregation ATPase